MKALTKLMLSAAITLSVAGSALYAVRADAKSVSGGDDGSTVNASLSVDADTTVGSLRTVNGGIDVDSGATTTTISTVNGGIDLGSGVTTSSISSVNGSIDADGQVVVKGDISNVNGAIELPARSNVNGSVTNVNGDIDLSGTTIVRNVKTVNGRIELAQAQVGGSLETVWGRVELSASQVSGDLRVAKPRGMNWGKPKKPVVVIGPNSVVRGTISLEHPTDLYVHASANIGAVIGGEAQRYSSNTPPQ
jgi:DUF4097 and DUF4098 domain-containing protein YvlB